jgi:hypothetical protein
MTPLRTETGIDINENSFKQFDIIYTNDLGFSISLLIETVESTDGSLSNNTIRGISSTVFIVLCDHRGLDRVLRTKDPATISRQCMKRAT